MKRLLRLLAVSEGLTGLIALVYPPIVVRLLFDAEIDDAGVSMSRIAGISLIALGTACWPDHHTFRAFVGMLTYSLLAALYLASVGVSGEVGILLWPAVAGHAGLSLLLVWTWWMDRNAPQANRSTASGPGSTS
jgi:hypothetical protein